MNIPFYQTPNTGAQVWSFYNVNRLSEAPIFQREYSQRLWHRLPLDVVKQ